MEIIEQKINPSKRKEKKSQNSDDTTLRLLQHYCNLAKLNVTNTEFVQGPKIM